MFAFYSKLTPAQQFVLSGVASLLFAAITTTIAATWQFYTQQGQLNINALFVFAVGTFGAAISTAMYHFIPPHFREILQASQDSEAGLREALSRQQSITQSAINKNVTQVSQAQNSATPQIHVYMPQPQTYAATMTVPADVSTQVQIPSVFSTEPHVADLATLSVPAVSIASVDVPQVPQLPFSLASIPTTAVQPDYSSLRFGDTGIVPIVNPVP